LIEAHPFGSGSASVRPSHASSRLGVPPVEPDRPWVDRVHLEMRFAPRIAPERGANGILRLGLNGVHHAVLVGERSAQDDEARVNEPVHERCVRGPAGLLLQRPRRVPLRAGATKHYEERSHAHFSTASLRDLDGGRGGAQSPNANSAGR
jgi:hypothetical protein